MNFWYYLNGQKLGPVSFVELQELVRKGAIGRKTIIENQKGQRLEAGKAPKLFPPQGASSNPRQTPESNPFLSGESFDSPFVVPEPVAEPVKTETPSASYSLQDYDPPLSNSRSTFGYDSADSESSANENTPVKPARKPSQAFLIVERFLQILGRVVGILGAISIFTGLVSILLFSDFKVIEKIVAVLVLLPFYTVILLSVILAIFFIRALIKWLIDVQEDLSVIRAHLDQKRMEE